MKKLGFAFWVWVVMTGLAGAQSPDKLKGAAWEDPLKKPVEVVKQSEFVHQMSYALGYDVFTHVSGQVDLDMAAFIQGVTDAQNKTPRFDPEKMRQMLSAYQRLARRAAMEKRAAMIKENRSKGGIFLEGNKLKQGVTSLASGLQYRVITQGTGPVPGPGDTVECHYKGRLIDGREFDSSFSRGRPAVFQVSQVIPGWAQALTLMPVGSKWELYIPADLAYGDQGAGDVIQPGHTLIFELALLGILDPS